MTCLAVGAIVLALSSPTFQLSWTHSVEHVEWQEEWRVSAAGLTLDTARIRGSGAGMEPGDRAVLKDGWWEWPGALSVPSLALAASGATAGGWTICTDGTCSQIGTAPGAPLIIAPCGDLIPEPAASSRTNG